MDYNESEACLTATWTPTSQALFGGQQISSKRCLSGGDNSLTHELHGNKVDDLLQQLQFVQPIETQKN
ncbi:hypothetical protein ACTXT7_013840 [Hymenolepis weldensis]